MTNLRKIGKNIASCRQQLKLTQEDLAGLTEIDRSYLSEIENGHKNMSVEILLKVAKALRVSPSKLID